MSYINNLERLFFIFPVFYHTILLFFLLLSFFIYHPTVTSVNLYKIKIILRFKIMLPVSAEERLKKITELLSWYNRPLFFCSSTQSLVYKFYCSQFNFVLKNPVQSDENFFRISIMSKFGNYYYFALMYSLGHFLWHLDSSNNFICTSSND